MNYGSLNKSVINAREGRTGVALWGKQRRAVVYSRNGGLSIKGCKATLLDACGCRSGGGVCLAADIRFRLSVPDEYPETSLAPTHWLPA